MVHLQGLLPAKIKIPSALHRNDRVHDFTDNSVPYAVHFQLFHAQFRQIGIHLQDVLLRTTWNHLLHLCTQEPKTGLRAYNGSLKTEYLCV